MIYIAGPFFNPTQLAVIESIEDACGMHNIEFMSPRLEGGVLKDMTPEERKQAADDVFDMNVKGVKDCDAVIAVIDDYDAGTMIEIGMAYAFGKRIITVTNNNYGLNVMLAKPVEAHTDNAQDAIAAYLGVTFRNLKTEVVT